MPGVTSALLTTRAQLKNLQTLQRREVVCPVPALYPCQMGRPPYRFLTPRVTLL